MGLIVRSARSIKRLNALILVKSPSLSGVTSLSGYIVARLPCRCLGIPCRVYRYTSLGWVVGTTRRVTLHGYHPYLPVLGPRAAFGGLSYRKWWFTTDTIAALPPRLGSYVLQKLIEIRFRRQRGGTCLCTRVRSGQCATGRNIFEENFMEGIEFNRVGTKQRLAHRHGPISVQRGRARARSVD